MWSFRFGVWAAAEGIAERDALMQRPVRSFSSAGSAVPDGQPT